MYRKKRITERYRTQFTLNMHNIYIQRGFNFSETTKYAFTIFVRQNENNIHDKELKINDFLKNNSSRFYHIVK